MRLPCPPLTSLVLLYIIQYFYTAERIGCGDNTDMSQSNVHKWSTLFFLVPSSFALAYFVYYLATFSPSHADARASSSAAPVRLVTPTPSDKITLVKGKTQTIGGKIELTYQGMDTNFVVIDITLLDLDRNYTYRRKIPKKVALRGFRLAQRQYQLISANGARLKMVCPNQKI
jgi:hypothetical protein